MTSTGADLLQTYVNTLRVHAHWLIAEGYARMDNAAFESAEEPAITGELVREMRAYMESGDIAPPWVCYYSIHDDPPLSVGGKLGKARPRVDIEFERMTRGPRPRLRFEAKRLDSTTEHTVSGYLGRDGLGCFLSGRYPMTHGEAGMLGYVQSENETIWVGRIGSALSRDRKGLAVMDPLLSHQRVHPALHHTYRSHHSRNTDQAPVVVHHVLLRFGASGGRASREPRVVPSQTQPGHRLSNLHSYFRCSQTRPWLEDMLYNRHPSPTAPQWPQGHPAAWGAGFCLTPANAREYASASNPPPNPRRIGVPPGRPSHHRPRVTAAP